MEVYENKVMGKGKHYRQKDRKSKLFMKSNIRETVILSILISDVLIHPLNGEKIYLMENPREKLRFEMCYPRITEGYCPQGVQIINISREYSLFLVAKLLYN